MRIYKCFFNSFSIIQFVRFLSNKLIDLENETQGAK
jgi:hypothetical protein